jgi:hypothetical protein
LKASGTWSKIITRGVITYIFNGLDVLE